MSSFPTSLSHTHHNTQISLFLHMMLSLNRSICELSFSFCVSVCITIMSICISCYLCLWCCSLSVFIFLYLLLISPLFSLILSIAVLIHFNPIFIHLPSHFFLSIPFSLFSSVMSSNWFSFLPASQFFIKSSVIISVWSVICLSLS